MATCGEDNWPAWAVVCLGTEKTHPVLLHYVHNIWLIKSKPCILKHVTESSSVVPGKLFQLLPAITVSSHFLVWLCQTQSAQSSWLNFFSFLLVQASSAHWISTKQMGNSVERAESWREPGMTELHFHVDQTASQTQSPRIRMIPFVKMALWYSNQGASEI